MTDLVVLFIITVGVCALVFVVWLIGTFVDGRHERKRILAWRQELEQQERTLNVRFGAGPVVGKVIVSKELAEDISASAPSHDENDDTRTWPGPGAMA